VLLQAGRDSRCGNEAVAIDDVGDAAGTVVEDLETELPRIARGISIRSDVSGAIPIAFGKVSPQLY
jgi:hypothetical protein